ncbi:family 20 glycosylhydrolase [Dokdonella soli]|uniref:beta-N-acetylhexosaminidase n=1 Tax=Dokdonella soli TaxID=529810 RepID=A0ABN1IMJ3_9GAMM
MSPIRNSSAFQAAGPRTTFVRAAFTLLVPLILVACTTTPTRTPDHPALSLIPQPARIEPRPGTFHLRQGAPLIVASHNAEAAAIARRFADLLASTRGIHLDVRPFGDGDGDVRDAIVFSLDANDTLAPAGEGYELLVDTQHMRINAREAHGLFYGGVTLWQLLTQETTPVASIDVPALRIVDEPRLAWRGAMLDSSRHFQPPEFVKRFIDQLALLKLNTFHWHLTDDQGWRIEIRRYPRLTEVGAWRRPAGAAGTDANGQPVRYGGFYTQDQIRDIVRYAAERNITIVPEIDMPGHMQAAIAAYPELGSIGDKPVVSPDWGVHSYLLNTDDATFTFMQNVLDEIMQLFPGAYIHVGGDEAIKDQWKASPRVQARMHELGIADEDHLQGWFIARLQKYLAAHGRKLIGWDETLEGGLPPDATVMSWRGAQGGIDAARAGHDVVMAPSPDLYLDHLQSDAADEPSGRPDLRTLADIYAFQPAPASMDAAATKHVLGAQANLWTEHMRTTAMVEHAAFPRLAALAEALWSPPPGHDWPGFVARLVPQMERWRALGIAAADSAFEVRFAEDHDREHGRMRITLSNQVALPIRYITDGREPTATSPLYREALQLPVPAALRAATFLGDHRVGAVQARDYTPDSLLRRSSDALKQCSGKLTLRLEHDAPASGPRAFFDVDLFDPCWIYERAPLDGIDAIAVAVGRLPYNFQLAHDTENIVPRPAPASAHGELLVKLDSCAGATIATLPLDPALANPAVTTLHARLPPHTGAHDLCLVFSGRGHDPLWAIDSVQLVPASR